MMRIKRRRKLGRAFTDEVLKVTQPFGHFGGKKLKSEDWEDNLLPNYQPENESIAISSWRIFSLGTVFLIIFFSLFLRVFHLQIVQGQENRQRADVNRIQLKVIHAPRGVIYDRNEVILAENKPGFRLKDKLITRDEALKLEAKNDPSVDAMEIDAIRDYQLGFAASHILGYVGQISPEELKDPKYEDYKIGDRIGRSGVEQVYESVLRGKDGAEIIEIDATGKKLRTLRQVDPIPGQNLYLSIDADLQKVTYDALLKGVKDAKVEKGAAVAEDPVSGEILALVSIPSYDSNAFTDPEKGGEVGQYFEDTNSPLMNRVISGTYPPGSTFKITSALAGLSSGKISSNTQFEDTGVMAIGQWTFPNWYFLQYGRTDGTVDVKKALQRSNDIFFYKVGEAVGEKILGETAKKIGMGEKLGIDLPGESAGLVPDNIWKQKNTGEAWYPGDTLHMAIGQGFMLVTPLQVLAETAFIANRGNLVVPHLATKITYQNGAMVKSFSPNILAKNLFKKSDIEIVKDGLVLVPKDGGTAWPFFTFSIPTAGKTGTAEYGDPKDLTHAWYTSYAPVDDPRIALTVLVESGGEGSNIAAPIAREIYNWYFNPDKNNLKNLDNGVASDSAKMLGE